MRQNNFDKVAFAYDFLVRVFFGSSLRRAQRYYLNKIPQQATILVVGSGTGWIAEEILNQLPESQITLIDASEQMTQQARRKLAGKSVEILCTDESKIFSIPFDAVMLPCFLDLFSEEKLKSVIQSIKKNMKPNSIWIITDFVSAKRWQRVYLWIMYRFFKWTCNIEAAHLPNWQSALKEAKIEAQERKEFYSGFLMTTIGSQR